MHQDAPAAPAHNQIASPRRFINPENQVDELDQLVVVVVDPKKKQAKLTHSTGIDDNKKNAFIQELRAIGIIDDKLKLDIIKKFLLNESYLMQHSRSLTNDFMKIISKENDGENKIYSKIRPHCEKNFNAIGNICFCCGETITQQHEKACDHVIPIITMLMTVTADSVPHNLH